MTKELKEEFIKEASKCMYPNNEKRQVEWAKFLNKDIDDVFKIGEYYYPIEKPSIKKSFCFGHGFCGISTDEESNYAHEMAEKAQQDVAYFLNENLEGLNQQIAELKFLLISDWDEQQKFYEENRDLIPYKVKVSEAYLYASYSSMKNRVKIGFFDEEAKGWKLPDYVLRKPTKEEIETILAEYEEAKKRFMKRLNTYLKKYGLSKVRSWTYLVD